MSGAASMLTPGVLQGLSTGVQAVGQIQQGRAAYQAGNYNAAIADRNATIVTQEGDAQAAIIARRGNQVVGQAVANYGASGVTMEGSPLDVIAASARNNVADQLATKYSAGLRASSFTQEGALDRAGAANARTSSYLTAIGGATAGAAKAWQYSKGGIPIPMNYGDGG